MLHVTCDEEVCTVYYGDQMVKELQQSAFYTEVKFLVSLLEGWALAITSRHGNKCQATIWHYWLLSLVVCQASGAFSAKRNPDYVRT
jgi:hypothetical protein